MLLKHHPDKNGGKESEKYLAVDTAWKVLGDEKKRAVYDAELSNAKLLREQDAAVWMSMNLSELELDNDIHFYKCRCGGVYQVDVQEVEDVKHQRGLYDVPAVEVADYHCSTMVRVSIV